MKARLGIFGVTGWKNSGKTRMVACLVAEFSARGLRVSTVKHAHHSFDIDQEGRDSWQHRQAGASEVALVSRNRWALMHELRGEDEPELDSILDRLSPCDLVIVEGYKREAHPKIEMIRSGNTPAPSAEATRSNPPLWPDDPAIVMIGSAGKIEDCPLPRFDPDAIAAIADFILDYLRKAARNAAE
ncbi:MAG: molybdopterin-guanine dinucleotide biosynthesis protein B [Nitratireductor sp.]|nr:molybdopterin-guanine dinucleotide biosynthesis protein B [Nitratireductor sp.]